MEQLFKINPKFFENLVSTLVDRIKEDLPSTTEKEWLSSLEVQEYLGIGKTKLQQLRDENAFIISYISPKIILYEKKSLNEFIQSKTLKL